MALYLLNYNALTPAQIAQLRGITLPPAQQRYAGTIDSALHTLNTTQSADICGLALLVDATPQAFMLLRRGALLPYWARTDAAILQALQVDEAQQRRGLGRFFLTALAAHVREMWPEVRCLQLSVAGENQAALSLYRRQGWVDTGPGFRVQAGFERQMTFVL